MYYRIFITDGAVPTRQPADARNLYLGRIEAVQVTPPHTVGSVIRCICKLEGIGRFRFARLFLSSSSPSPMDRFEHVDILTGTGPGSDPRRPLALVLADGLDGFGKVIVAKNPSSEPSSLLPNSCCSALIDMSCTAQQDSAWLTYRKGEILYTDGIVQRKATKLSRSSTHSECLVRSQPQLALFSVRYAESAQHTYRAKDPNGNIGCTFRPVLVSDM